MCADVHNYTQGHVNLLEKLNYALSSFFAERRAIIGPDGNTDQWKDHNENKAIRQINKQYVNINLLSGPVAQENQNDHVACYIVKPLQHIWRSGTRRDETCGRIEHRMIVLLMVTR